jgi:hypothetical protein
MLRAGSFKEGVMQAKTLDEAVVKLDIIEPCRDASVENCTRDDGYLGLISGKLMRNTREIL